jgi:citronellol/citronellal dehydrogenase
MTTLRSKTIFITGGRAMAHRAAADGARIVIAAKTDAPHPKLPGTIHTVAKEIIELCGEALPLVVDVRDDAALVDAVAVAVKRFGGIDVLVNNASAVNLSKTLDLPMSRFDLIFDINVRGTFAATKACLPHLKTAQNPHVLTLSPPLDLVPRWFGDHCGYTISKYAMSMTVLGYAMSMTVLGFAAEFRDDGMAVNALWPRTMIETAASEIIGVSADGCRRPEIMADAAYAILTRDSRTCTGNFFLDEDVLRDSGTSNFERYASTPGASLVNDLFVHLTPACRCCETREPTPRALCETRLSRH